MSRSNQQGFTIVELTVAMTLIAILSVTAFPIFNTAINNYLALQKDSMLFDDLTAGSQRVGTVLRGLTDITTASANDMSFYAYFSPNDAYVSTIHYYLSAGNASLLADVTPMTADPPNGVPITASKKTYTIIGNFYKQQNVDTFVYLDAAGATLAMPVSDLHTIKGIKVNLAVPINSPTANGKRTINLQVSLRNRKTNL